MENGCDFEGGKRVNASPHREELLFALALTKPPAERVAWPDREIGNAATTKHCVRASPS